MELHGHSLLEASNTSLMALSDSEDETSNHPYHASRNAAHSFGLTSRRSRRKSLLHTHKPRSLRTPSSPLNTTIPNNKLPSAPASPPTPAPSPSPHRRTADWSTAQEDEETSMREYRSAFSTASKDRRQRMLAEILNLCTNQDLLFVHDYVCPRLKRDPFANLPDELSLRILSFVDHPRTLGRASQVSKRWHELVNDDMAWKSLCEQHAYRRTSEDSDDDMRPSQLPSFGAHTAQPSRLASGALRSSHSLLAMASNSAPDLLSGSSLDGAVERKRRSKRPFSPTSYRTHFKRRYMVETAWRAGGQVQARQLTPDQGVVTSLHLTDKYVVVGLDNSKIHVFDTQGGNQKTLNGHQMGVWAMVPWGDTLVSGGCDREVRVWNMATGQCVHTLRGHSSTVRCLRMSDANTAITGSRDTTLRVWDLTTGTCKHVLLGHLASVRCVEVHGDLVASGSYDTYAKIWSISEGKCLRTLHGHFSQIYAIAFDGRRVATGSLDTTVRIWNPHDGQCLALLSGHTSLVGQLQMRGDRLVTGGSDGSVRVWSLADYKTVHRLAAHDNSVTSLQFNDSRIISGGSDGRVKVWDLKTGVLIRELGDPADAVWRVVFEEEKAIVMACRNLKTIMEVWSFAPPGDVTAQPMTRSTSIPMSVAMTASSSLASTSDVEMTDEISTTSEPSSYLHNTFRLNLPHQTAVDSQTTTSRDE